MIESKELREGGKRLNESFENYFKNFCGFMKILKRFIQKEDERTTKHDVDQFENSEEGDSQSEHYSDGRKLKGEIENTLVD